LNQDNPSFSKTLVENGNSVSLHFEDNLQKLQDAQAVIHQVSKGFQIHQGIKTQEMQVKLHPQYLGEVNVKVQIHESGVVNVQLVANHGHVRDLLENNMVALRSSLENSDLKVEDIQVSLSEDSHNFEGKGFVEENAGNDQGKGMDQGSYFDEVTDENTPVNTLNQRNSFAGPSLYDRMFQINRLA
jgi:flagellar hook-length control protein FliK